jgi:hypothetical protein
MQRRYLPALKDHRNRPGAFATVWEGWVNPRGRSFDVSGRKNVTYPRDVNDAEDRTGCYAILYDTGGGNLYVAYIGSSKSVRTELKQKYREWGIAEESYFPYTAQYIPGLSIAREIESDLIRYYCPPWNVRFS